MICGKCAEGRHGRCEDVVRHEQFTHWLRKAFGHVVVGGEQLATINANRPYKSCPCHHAGADVIDQTDASAIAESARAERAADMALAVSSR